MKLHDASSQDHNAFTAYGDDYVAVNGVSYRRSLIVTTMAIDDTWSARTSLLTEADIAPLLAFRNCIVLLGTGPKQAFPPLKVLRDLAAQGIALEVMDSFAACRTFNILAAEGRPVAAALVLNPESV